MIATVAALRRHPLKGFPGEDLTRADLRAGGHFPGDRLFAVENGRSGFDPAAPAHLPKIKFLMQMRHERLARLTLCWDDAARTLTLGDETGARVTGDPASEEDRAALEQFIARVCAAELTGAPRLLVAPDGHRFMDSRKGFVSILNRASIQSIEDAADTPVDARRFRGNILMSGLPAWSEFDLVGKRFRIGSATFVGLARIDRCAATDVDPETGVRDIRMVPLLERAFEHHDCGIYARIETGGPVALGDSLSVLSEVPAAESSGLPF